VAGKPERAKAVRNGLFNKIAGHFQEKSKSVKKAPAIASAGGLQQHQHKHPSTQDAGSDTAKHINLSWCHF
jgi:hypothetical protein